MRYVASRLLRDVFRRKTWYFVESYVEWSGDQVSRTYVEIESLLYRARSFEHCKRIADADGRRKAASAERPVRLDPSYVNARFLGTRRYGILNVDYRLPADEEIAYEWLDVDSRDDVASLLAMRRVRVQRFEPGFDAS